MATFKSSYTRNPVAAKASIAYIIARPNRQGHAQSRTLFGSDGDVSIDQARRMISQAQSGTVFYRFILSPDPRREDTRRDIRLSQVALATIRDLEARLGRQIPFVGAIHDDHSPYRHVHLIALVQGRRLDIEDLAAIRASATAASLLERRLADLTRERPPRVRFPRRYAVPQWSSPQRRIAVPGQPPTKQVVRRRPQQPPALATCPRCRLFQSPSLFQSTVALCAYCGLHYQRGRGNRQEAGWSL